MAADARHLKDMLLLAAEPVQHLQRSLGHEYDIVLICVISPSGPSAFENFKDINGVSRFYR